MARPLPLPVRSIARLLLRAWGFFPKAPGYYYQAVERWGPRLGVRRLEARLFSGARVSCDLRDHVERHMYFFGAYEPIDAHLFRALLRRGMTVVDAGANVGQYSLIAAAAVGTEGEVHAFEPVPKNFDRLTAHVESNGLAKIVTANRMALWHRPARLPLCLSVAMHDNAGAFTLGTVTDAVESLQCDTVRLDDYIASSRIRRLDVMKMDVEGAELFVLQGATAALTRWRPTMLMEINRELCRSLGYEPEQIWDLLKPMGYRMLSVGHSPVTCEALRDLHEVDRANVIFHLGELPEAVRSGWSQKGILRSHRRNCGL